MPVSDEYIDYILDQLSGFGEVIPRRMFGGAGLFHKGLMFALIADDVLYLKVDERNRGAFESKGCGPFRPYDDDRIMRSYFEAPIDIIEDHDELDKWAGTAFEIAVDADRRKPARKGQKGIAGRGRRRS